MKQRLTVLILGLISLISLPLYSQESLGHLEMEKEILDLKYLPLLAKTDSERISAGFKIQDLLMEGLKSEASFQYPFDSLKYSTIAIASDDKTPLRIFTYNAILSTGKFVHFGVIQYKQKKSITTFSLLDSSENLPKNADEEAMPSEQWIGALYYQIKPFKFNKKQLYLVFGFDGHNLSSNRSILDVLYFEENEPVFGFPLFRSGDEDPTPENRVIFEYHKSAKMVLRYQPEVDMIILDHLEPAYERVKGNYSYYIPTGDYEGYAKEGKTWVKKQVNEMPFAEDPKKIDVKKLPKPTAEELKMNPGLTPE